MVVDESVSLGGARALSTASHHRHTDAIAHVVRCFDDENVMHVAGKVSPLDDISVITTELALADLDAVDRALRRAQKAGKGQNKDAPMPLTDAATEIVAHGPFNRQRWAKARKDRKSTRLNSSHW